MPQDKAGWLPGFLRVRLARAPGLQRILGNLSWLFGDRVIRLGLGMVVGVWVARYLGPGQFGLLAYVQAVAALFTGISTLGLDQILIRELVQRPERRSSLLGTALALRLGGSALAMAAVCLTAVLASSQEGPVLLLAAVLGAGAVFHALDVIDLWFQSQVQSKYSVLAKNSVFLLVVCTKAGLILLRAPLIAFAWAQFIEALLGALALWLFYQARGGRLRRWKVEVAVARDLLRAAWPLLLSGVAVMVYMRIDQVMLARLSGVAAVGYYTAASRISEVWYFLPMAVMSSVMPSLVAAKSESELVYRHRTQLFFRAMLGLALVLVVPVALLAGPIVDWLFGPAYSPAGPVLAVQIWTTVFVFLGVAQTPWFVIENQTRLALQRTLGGALVNVGLNLWLIPKYGAMGAAWSSLVAQFASNLVLNYPNRASRDLFWMLVRSFNVFSGWSLPSLPKKNGHD